VKKSQMDLLATLPGNRLFWKHFAFCCTTPRESRKCQRISAEVAEMGRQWGYEVAVDHVGNVVIRKPASAGLENRPYLCLQAHLDMVCEKEAGSPHDFAKDPILPRLVGDKLMATGTTLGADNGVGVALALWIAEDKTLRHGPLEILLTVDEEIGLVGAMALPHGFLRSRRLINLDSEEDWRVCIGCAGGFDAHIHVALPTSAEGRYPEEAIVSLVGLHGGHSGVEIHKGHANAIQLLGRILLQVALPTSLGSRSTGPEEAALLPAGSPPPFQLLGMIGGTKRNAIPVSAQARILIPGGPAREAVLAALRKSYEAVAKEWHVPLEETMKFHVHSLADKSQIVSAHGHTAPCPEPQGPALPAPLTHDGCMRFLRALQCMPYGVLRMSPSVEGLVETSCNLAKISLPCARTEGLVAGQVYAQFEFLARSSCNSQQGLVYDQMVSLVQLLNIPGLPASITEPINWHNGWLPNPSSHLLQKTKEVYRAVKGKDIGVYAIHAGLECGVIGEKYPEMESISIGPTIEAVHTPKEALFCESVAPFCEYLIRLIAELD